MPVAKHIMQKQHADEKPEEVIISVKNISKSFGKKKILKNISFQINKGENAVVLGKSGSGKSVMAKCLVRLEEPDDGKVFLFGKNILEFDEDDLNETRKKIGFLFQGAALYDSMNVQENLEFHLRDNKDLSESEINSRVKEALKNVGLEKELEKMPSELSGGMKKRIGLARAIILKPEIIIYDEPTAGLDPLTSHEITNLILSIQKKFNATSLIITHDLECARMAGNKLILIDEGTLIAQGTFEELKNSPEKSIRSFFGQPDEKNKSHEKEER